MKQKIILLRSKWIIMSQCVYFVVQTMVLFRIFFRVLLSKKKNFVKRNFQMKYFKLLIIVFIVALVSHIFQKNQIWINMNFFECINFTKFFVSSWKMITISNYAITYWNFKCYFLYYKLQLFFKQYIRCITFTCCKGLTNFKQTLIFYKHKIEKIWKFECFLCV